MAAKDLFFVIPTYRLRDVGEAVAQYDEHFWRNGHSVRMIIFDDSSPVSQEKYYSLLEQTKTHNEIYYVGPHEKERFLAHLNGRLRDKRLESLVKNLFKVGGDTPPAIQVFEPQQPIPSDVPLPPRRAASLDSPVRMAALPAAANANAKPAAAADAATQ